MPIEVTLIYWIGLGSLFVFLLLDLYRLIRLRRRRIHANRMPRRKT